MDAGPRDGFLRNFDGLQLDSLVTRTPHNWGGLVKMEEKDKGWSENKRMIQCTFPWYCLTVLYDGTVCLCPQDFRGSINVGDLNKSTIRDIFNSEKTLEMRRILGRGSAGEAEPCNNCDRIRRKTFIGIPGEHISSFIRDNFTR